MKLKRSGTEPQPKSFPDFRFETDGIELIQNAVDVVSLDAMTNESAQLVSRARKGLVPDIRIYDDFPHIFGGVNVVGVENPIPNLPTVVSWLNARRLETLVTHSTKRNTEALEVVRLHCNSRFKWRNFWHQDADQEFGSAVAVVYLEPEDGFRVLLRRSTSSPNPQNLFADLGDAIKISAHRGDILVFDGNLWHKGHSTSRRLHLHFRFRLSSQRQDDNSQAIDWHQYSKAPAGEDSTHIGLSSGSAASRVARWLRLIQYLLPSRRRSSIFQRS